MEFFQNKDLVYIPLCVFAAVSLLAAVVMLWLPETKNKPMPETLDEAEKFPDISRNIAENGQIKENSILDEKF